MNRRFTASSAAIAKHCLYSWKDGVRTLPVEADEKMERGTRGHKASAKMLMGRALSAAEESEFSEQLDAVRAFVGSIRPGRHHYFYVEPAFAWTPGGECWHIGNDIDRKYDEYGAKPGDICGSADILLVYGENEDIGRLVDLKFSNAIDDLNTKYHDQLRVLATMAAEAFGLTRVYATTFNPDSPPGKIEWLTFDLFDFEDTGRWLDGLAEAADKSSPNPGDWCAFCPARTDCPATRQALAEAPKWNITTVEDVARYWPRIAPIYDLLEEIKFRCREVVEREGGVDLANGKRLALIPVQGRESVSISSLPENVQEELRARGIIKRSEPTKQLRVVGGKK